CDCCIRDDNEGRILRDLSVLLPQDARYIDALINTHRDADHVRGIERLDRVFPIQRAWDSGAAGTSTDSPEYEAYMRIRRNAPECGTLQTGETIRLGPITSIRVLHSASDERPDDCNREGVVFKLEHGGNSILFSGDCDTITWKRVVASNGRHLRSSILVAPHHGAIRSLEDNQNLGAVLAGIGAPRPGTFRALDGLPPLPAGFGVPRRRIPARLPVTPTNPLAILGRLALATLPTAQVPQHYTAHLRLIRPSLTVISAGRNNPHGHPSPEAVRIYERHTTGFDVVGRPGQLKKITRTDFDGGMVTRLADRATERGTR